MELCSESEFFDTNYECGYKALIGAINSPPREGELTCTAEDGSSVKAIAETSLLRLDGDGDSDYEYSENTNVFSEAVEGYLFGDSPQ